MSKLKDMVIEVQEFVEDHFYDITSAHDMAEKAADKFGNYFYSFAYHYYLTVDADYNNHVDNMAMEGHPVYG